MASLLWIKNGLKKLRISGISAPATLDSAVQNQARSPFFGVEAKNIPLRPKKPLTPYFRFLGQVRDQVKKENPAIKQTELMKLVGQRWDELDDSNKERYILAYKNEMQTYGAIIEEYNESLTDEHKEALQQLKFNKQTKKELRERRQRIKELGRPKKPASAFLKFLQTKVTAGATSQEYIAAAKHWGAKWKEIPDSEKASFLTKYQQEFDEYSKVLTKWEDKMIRQGNDDLVRRRPAPKARKAAAK